MVVSGDRRIMGDRVNGRPVAAVGWLTAGVMALAAIALVVVTLGGAV
jgi:Mn2+/Fe2+ NRAMP family transporter